MDLVIRTDANTNIGVGHFMRCLALAQAWKDKGGKVTFFTACDSEELLQRLRDEGFEVQAMKCSCPDPADLEIMQQALSLHKNAWVVLDGYNFDSSYQAQIKEMDCKLLVIDDTAHLEHYYADIVLNQNLNADQLHYSCEPYTHLLLGSRYVLLRREFLNWQGRKRKIPKIASHVLVTFGGADSENCTLKVIEALRRLKMPDLEVRVVIGATNPHTDAVAAISSNSEMHIRLIKNTTNMSELMNWADLAISSGGSTCWELMFCGLPACVAVIAENQTSSVRELAARGLIIDLGHSRTLNEQRILKDIKPLMAKRKLRLAISEKGQQLVDGKGTQRVIDRLRVWPRKPESGNTDNDTQGIRAFWNSRAGLGFAAGTKDVVSKQIEAEAIAGYISDGMRVLDVGCGNGITAIELAQRYKIDIVGLDFAEKMINEAQAKANEETFNGSMRFLVGDVQNLPKSLGLFDLIYTERVLINLPDWQTQKKAISNVSHLLKENGFFVMCENSEDSLKKINRMRESLNLKIISPPWHNRYLKESEIEETVLPGLVLEEINDFSSTYYFLSRVVNAWIAAQEDKEPSYDAPINKLALQLPSFGDFGQVKIWVWRKSKKA